MPGLGRQAYLRGVGVAALTSGRGAAAATVPNADSPTVAWDRQYADGLRANVVLPTGEGGTILGGRT